MIDVLDIGILEPLVTIFLGVVGFAEIITGIAILIPDAPPQYCIAHRGDQVQWAAHKTGKDAFKAVYTTLKNDPKHFCYIDGDVGEGLYDRGIGYTLHSSHMGELKDYP